jgi:hypothetical protein
MLSAERNSLAVRDVLRACISDGICLLEGFEHFQSCRRIINPVLTVEQYYIKSPPTISKMKPTGTLSTLSLAINLSQATVYLAGDSTMALNGANDGVTDGTHTPIPSQTTQLPN